MKKWTLLFSFGIAIVLAAPRVQAMTPWPSRTAAKAVAAWSDEGQMAPGRRPSDDPPRCAKPGDKVKAFPPDSRPFGRSYAEWSAAWWQWAYSAPASINPITDPTGAYCAVGQDGPVWFLAGTFGGPGSRTCDIPCNRALLFPIVNCEWENIWECEPVRTIAELRAICAGYMDGQEVHAEVDGKPIEHLERYRVLSDLFDYSFPPDNIGGQPPGVYFPVVGDGWYVMLEPLSPGEHTVHFWTGNGFQDMTYTLNVRALELPCSSPPCSSPPCE